MDPKKKHARRVLKTLAETYPQAHCELDFQTPFQLLIATILSAQSTDEQVNKLTGPLFAACPDPQSMSKLTVEELEQYIKGCGLYHNKAKNILATCSILLDKYSGKVPRTRDELTELPGVGRKTANVVLSNAFDIPAFAVDTHVLRVSKRLGLADGKTPDQVEEQVTALVPKKQWKDAHHWLIWHGRRMCHARKPNCRECPLQKFCPEVNRKGDNEDE